MQLTLTQDRRVVLIGVGGASCSGKTTLAKHLQCILPNSVIVHQDDFTRPESQIPIHPIHHVQDWDSPSGAIDWQRLIEFLRHVKATGAIPSNHHSHVHLHEQKEIPISDEHKRKWVSEFSSFSGETTWVIVDGFLLYWHPEVLRQIDVQFFLRVPHDILEQRRNERDDYCTAVQSDAEGSWWRDPPGYWKNIVYPAYATAHRDMFENGDVEHGKLTGGIEGMILLPMIDLTMDKAVDHCCVVIKERCNST